MSDVKAAAERLRRIESGESASSVYLGYSDGCYDMAMMMVAEKKLSGDYRTLARAYLAEHDEEPITEEWLRSVGFERLKSEMFTLSTVYRWFLTTVNGGFAFVDSGGAYLCCLKSRGDIRRLCSALGITLKGE